MIILLDKIPKNEPLDIGSGILSSLISITLVFLIIAIIIIVMLVIFKCQQVIKMRVSKRIPTDGKNLDGIDLSDPDADIAVLVASIDYREETKKDVRVISVKKVED